MLFPNGNKPVKISLYKNVPFDNSYSDHFFRPNFKNNELRYERVTFKYFLESGVMGNLYPKVEMSGTYNFDYGNGLVTRIVLEVDEDFTDANYLIAETSDSIFYFFITGVEILRSSEQGVTCRFSLENDVIAQYDEQIMNDLSKYPLLTKRKHCQRYVNGRPYCSDFVSTEPIENIKPNIIKKVQAFRNRIYNSEYNTANELLWFYVTLTELSGVDLDEEDKLEIIVNGKGVPTVQYTIAMPLVDVVRMTINYPDNPTQLNFQPIKMIQELVQEQGVYNIRVSPYPPYQTISDDVSLSYDDGILTMSVPPYFYPSGYSFNIGNANFRIIDDKYFLLVSNSYIPQESYPIQIIDYFGYTNINTEYVYDEDPKALLDPFRRYTLKSQYSEGVDIYPRLQLSYCGTYEQDQSLELNIRTFNIPYSLDTAISTFYYFENVDSDITEKYNYINYGLVSTPNYTLPTGSDALRAFNQTEKASYTTSKIAQGIGGVLQAGGGIISMAMGNPLGAIGIASGVSNIGSSIASSVSKDIDLKNTPDSLNAMGSNFWHDYVVSYENPLKPYVVVYELSPSEKEMVKNFFYQYGYNVQRYCNFNQDLKIENYSDTGWVDKRIFTRTLFNYVELGEDIKTKLTGVSNVIKAKISSIFNNGIRLWTFFNEPAPSVGDFIEDIEKYLLKTIYCNAEVN